MLTEEELEIWEEVRVDSCDEDRVEEVSIEVDVRELD